MLNIRESHEEERGCGFRQGGGIYLVSGNLGEPCAKMPIEMTVCPCCNQGIKPARGFTWVTHEIVSEAPCSADMGDCRQCHGLCGTPKKLGLIWVGGKYYPTPMDFTHEANTMGVSRRIPQVPKDFVVGETVILIAHRECSFPNEDGDGELKPGIFRTFIPSS